MEYFLSLVVLSLIPVSIIYKRRSIYGIPVEDLLFFIIVPAGAVAVGTVLKML